MYVPESASGLKGYQPLWSLSHVGKGSRQNRSVPLEKGLALRVELCAYVWVLELSFRCAGLQDPFGGLRLAGLVNFHALVHACKRRSKQRLSQNWHGERESDCLIKTKRCDGLCQVLTQRDFCPVL